MITPRLMLILSFAFTGLLYLGCKKKESERIPAEAEKALFEANQAFADKKFDSVSDLCDGVIRKHPEYLPPQVLKGKAFFYTKKFKEANEVFAKILEKEPGHQGALLWLARLAGQDKKTEPLAEQYLIHGLNNNPEDLSLHMELARHYAKSGNLRQAMVEYQKAMMIEYELPELYRNYEALLRQHKLTDRAERLKARRVGLESLPKK